MRDEVALADEGRGGLKIIEEPQVVTPRLSSRVKTPGRGGRTYLPRPGRSRDEVGTRDEVALDHLPRRVIGGLGRPPPGPGTATRRTRIHSGQEPIAIHQPTTTRTDPMPTPNRYQPPAQHKAWAARAALCVATDDNAALHLLLDQVTAHENGVNELVWALASECASLFEATGGVDSLALYAETWQGRANAEEGHRGSGQE